MKRSSTIVGIIVIIAAIVIVLSYLGYIPGLSALFDIGSLGGDGDLPDALQSEISNIEEYSKTDIYYMLVTLSGKTLNYDEALAHINALDMKAYGFDGKQYTDVMTQFDAEYVADGFTLQGSLPISSSNYHGALNAWTKGTTAKAVIAASGSAITSAYGHDTVALLASGLYSQYVSFITWITT